MKCNPIVAVDKLISRGFYQTCVILGRVPAFIKENTVPYNSQFKAVPIILTDTELKNGLIKRGYIIEELVPYDDDNE
jgi:hypothetical protein